MSQWWTHAIAVVVGTVFGWGCKYAKDSIVKKIDPNTKQP